MKFKLLILLALFPLAVEARCHKQYRVAVIDSGLDLMDPRFKDRLCLVGHRNFVPGTTMEDSDGHGSHIAGIIEQFSGDADYCLLIYKYYSPSDNDGNLKREILSLQEAVKNKADIVNFSGGGQGFNEDEYAVIKNNPKTTFVVAAGNDGVNLDVPGNEYFPASYWLKNVVVVENFGKNGRLYPGSNYSSRAVAEVGEDVFSYLPNGQTGVKSGTSQATATFTGKMLDKLSHSCDIGK